jgi:hypothetical protein
MTFEEAKAELIAEGCLEEKIRRVRVEFDVGVSPVWEQSKGVRAVRGEAGNWITDRKIIRYKLDDDSKLDKERREFWVPCAFHGNRGWILNYCAPDFVESKDKQSEFCETHYRKRLVSWPDSGERAPDPIEYINDQLAACTLAGLKASSDIPEKQRVRMAKEFERFNSVAFDYLSEAVELSVKKNEPPYSQFDRADMEEGRALPEWYDHDAARIIELAFRAGKASAQASLHYRGIPVLAEVGEPLSDGQAKAGPKKDWTKSAREFLLRSPSAKSAEVALYLKENSIVDWLPQGPYKDAHTICFYDGTPDKSKDDFSKAIYKVKKTIGKNSP